MQELGSGSLDPAGNQIQFADVSIRSPGIGGEVLVSRPSAGDSRAQALDSDALAKAFDSQNVDVDYIIEISGVTDERTDSPVSSRAMAPEHKGIEIQVPSVGDGWGQIAVFTDENGIATWHFPVAEDGGIDTTRAGSKVTFVIPGYVPETQPPAGSRGFLGWFGKKIVRVLSFVLDDVVGKVGEYFAAKWEEKNRPNDIRRITSSTYRTNGAGRFGAEYWQKLGAGRSLLFIHGTFSRASTAFYELTPDFIDRLNSRYSGRVFAFDHKTLSEDPTDNARFFAENMPNGQTLDVDIVCHSRGGLVSRILSEGQNGLPLAGRSLNVNQVVFVASPNRGTALADAKYMSDFVDAHTNILSVLPDNAVTDALEVIVAVVKQLAVGVLKGLEGVMSMDPKGDFLKQLNAGQESPAIYRAIAANFEPTDKKFKPWAKDKLMDRIFNTENDLVVPTKGVFEHNGDKMFPIEAEHVLALTGSDGVHHGSYFSNTKVVGKLDEWLTAD